MDYTNVLYLILIHELIKWSVLHLKNSVTGYLQLNHEYPLVDVTYRPLTEDGGTAMSVDDIHKGSISFMQTVSRLSLVVPVASRVQTCHVGDISTDMSMLYFFFFTSVKEDGKGDQTQVRPLTA